jgi:hypothetical protein
MRPPSPGTVGLAQPADGAILSARESARRRMSSDTPTDVRTSPQEFTVGRLVRLVTGGVLLLTMGICAGLLGIRRFQVVDIVVPAACGIVLVA